MRRRLVLVIALLGMAAAEPTSALAGPTQESTFQDDAHLVYGSSRTVAKTLATLASLGVQRIRVTLKWADVAPAAMSRRAPGGFNPGNGYATNPAHYPNSGWVRYDRVIKDAARLGIAVQLNLTAPGPLWAMQRHPAAAKAANHWTPSPRAFQAFVEATGLRYSGYYFGLPRVQSWSVWNEPNQPGWLAPQWRQVAGAWVPNSPRLYRMFVSAAYAGLYLSGHLPQDTFLIGELAPEGYNAQGALVAMTPMVFLRALYCVDRAYHPLIGTAATALGCPASGQPSDFAPQNFPLFAATGFAHHPYLFTAAPWLHTRNPDFAPLADITRLERGLDRTFGAYGIPRQIPIYFTEYGYETNPPDPYRRTSLADQAAYLNAADFLAWADPRVQSVSQFLLFDDRPDRRYRPTDFKYWDTFQTGLLFSSGSPKPALDAYRIPIWVSGSTVWGQVRPSTRYGPQTALVRWQSARGGAPRTLATTTTTPLGFLQTSVAVPGRGNVWIQWTSPHGHVLSSRAVAVR